MAPFRKTKIVCTVGPATESPAMLKKLIEAGVNVFRLNFSHGSVEKHVEIIRTIRRIAREQRCPVGILQDLGGPKIRLGCLINEPLEVITGSIINLISAKESRDHNTLPIDYPYLMEDVKEGDRILLGDGTLELIVEKKLENLMVAYVVVGGVVRSHKGVNLPSSSLRISSFTEKDERDLEVGIKEGIDFVALSFIRHEDDIKPVRKMISSLEEPILIIGKIEKPQAVARLDKILDNVDGVMVARGDLGVEMALEEVPLIQKLIIRKARIRSKPVITATQMLVSMVNSPRPTRAETSDVANAIIDGADALMLSEETAMGMYPLEAVMMVEKIAIATERNLGNFIGDDFLSSEGVSIEDAISRSAYNIAKELKASAIVASTASGKTARLVSRFRPAVPIVAVTHSEKTFNQLSLSWGVIPALAEPFHDTDSMFKTARNWVIERSIAKVGDKIVLTAGIPIGKMGTTNLIKVMEI